MLFSHKNRWNFAVFSKTNRLEGPCIKWNKSNKDKYCLISFICYFKGFHHSFYFFPFLCFSFIGLTWELSNFCFYFFFSIMVHCKILNILIAGPKKDLLFACSVAQSCPTFCDPHGLWSTRFLCPWISPSNNTGVGCHFLHQGVFQTEDWAHVSCIGQWVIYPIYM